jgi:hypothetical protein
MEEQETEIRNNKDTRVEVIALADFLDFVAPKDLHLRLAEVGMRGGEEVTIHRRLKKFVDRPSQIWPIRVNTLFHHLSPLSEQAWLEDHER